MSDLDFVADMLASSAVTVGDLAREAQGDERTDLRILQAQLGGSADLVRRLIEAERARGGRALLDLAARQRREGSPHGVLRVERSDESTEEWEARATRSQADLDRRTNGPNRDDDVG